MSDESSFGKKVQVSFWTHTLFAKVKEEIFELKTPQGLSQLFSLYVF